MAILLESVEFGSKTNPECSVAPVSMAGGTNPQLVSVWKRGDTGGPETRPIVVMRNLLPEDPVLFVPTFSRTGSEPRVDWSVRVLASAPVRVTAFGVEVPRTPVTPALEPSIGTKTGSISFLGSNTVKSDPIGFVNSRLDCVACRDITLEWTWNGGSVQQTTHRLYVILAPPTLPWGADPVDSERWLWPEVLDFAANWAEGATDTDKAATRITRAVFALGQRDIHQGGLRYGNMGYVPLDFDCAKFLKHLHGTEINSNVDCRDLASIVSTFANALGCRLQQAQFGGANLPPTIRLIGGTPLATFRFHELAWNGVGAAGEKVWDACLAYAANPPCGVKCQNYAARAFVAPPPAIRGPLYRANRAVTARLPQPLNPLVADTVRVVHPEFETIAPTAARGTPRDVQMRTAIMNEGLVSGAVQAILKTWSRVPALVAGETAWEARYTSGDQGAAELRLSLFSTPEEAELFAATAARNTPSTLVKLDNIGPGPDYAIGTENRQMMLVKMGRLVINARLAFGAYDLSRAVSSVVNSLITQLNLPRQ
jgi:hypothetical protein